MDRNDGYCTRFDTQCTYLVTIANMKMNRLPMQSKAVMAGFDTHLCQGSDL